MKCKMFSRLGALVLMLAMLVPCVMTAPAEAAGFAVELFHWNAVHPAETNMEKVSDNLRRSTQRYHTHKINSLNYILADGTPVTKMFYLLYSSPSANYGLPYTKPGAARGAATENLKLTFKEFTPTTTRGLEAINLHLTYSHIQNGNETPAFAANTLDVLVSKDGETWLEDSVGIRSWTLLGSAINQDGYRVLIYDIQTENLFDIEGFNPGDKLFNFMLRPYGHFYYSTLWFSMADVTLNGYETRADWEAAVPVHRTETYVGEETLRQIVVDHSYKISEVEFNSDFNFYSSWPALTGSVAGSQLFPKDITRRGPIYGRRIKPGYDLWIETIADGKYIGGNSAGSGYGMDCMSYAYDCYSRVSKSFSWVIWQCQSDPKFKILGDLQTSDSPTYTDTDIFAYNSKQNIFDAYTQLKPGDIITTFTSGGAIHIRIADALPTVVRNTDGTIDPNKSYVTFNEHGAVDWYYFRTPTGSIAKSNNVPDLESYLAQNPGYEFLYVSCTRTNWQYTFADLYNTYYVPYTLAEYQTGMVEDLDYQSLLLPKQGDITKGFTATVASNYHICKFSIQLLDTATGEVLYSDTQVGNPTSDDAPAQLYYDWHYETPELDALLGQLTNGSYRIGVSILAGPVTQLNGVKPTTTRYYDFTITDKSPALTVSVNAPKSAAKSNTVTIPVNVNGAYAAADVEIKFDSDKLTYVSGTITPNGLLKDVQVNKGIVRISLVDAAASSGQLAELVFTAKEDISGLGNLFTVKSAQLSTQDGADSDTVMKATNTSIPCASANFVDVAPSAWYHDAVDYALNNSIMGGYNATTFGPNDTLTRAMVVQVLYNKEGQPAINGSHKFPDVKSGDWFNNAVTWANINKVVGGYGDGRFGPNDKVTLEQIAVILWNYSGNPTPTGDASSLGAHSNWAANALSWAAAKGIFKNVPYNTVTGTATRAQTAQMLMNYLTK